jgi:predicted dehydrogenase
MKRRDFIKSSAALVASSGPVLGSGQGANDRIRVGLIGVGGRGLYELSVCQNNPGCEVVAVADAYRPLADMAVQRLGKKATGYGDFRRILDRKDIDAVFVSTPDHWHALAAIMACQAGKDVYCEKPLTHTIQEGRRMVEAARKYNRVVQTGSQQRSAPHFQKVVQLIQSGYIGKVTMVECWNVMNDTPQGIGNPPDSDPPEGLDWDLYLGPAPKVPYNRNRFIWCYRWFWDYSGGMMTDWGAHHMDVVQWAMGVDAPKAANAVGGNFVLKDNRQTPDTFMANFEYPGFVARYTVRNGNRLPLEGRDYGMMFYGSLGTLVVDRSSYAVLPEMRPEVYRTDIDQVENLLSGGAGIPPGSAIRPTKPNRAVAGARKPLCVAEEETGISIDPSSQIAHVQNFFDCVRSRQKPVADVEIGHRSITACHLGVIAYKVGRQVHWNAQEERIIGDDEAQKLVSKEYRAPWLLPTL